jgi:MFS family permease
VLALPGGAIGQWLGDKRTVLAALSLMLIGSLAMALPSAWSVQVAGRLVAGAGGVLLSVPLTKMVTDWFAGAEIATAMAIFVSSWPTGVALSLLTLPFIGTAYGVSAAYFTVVAFTATGFILLAIAYQASASSAAPAAKSARLDRNTVIAVVVAGLIWGLYNVGFALIFSFGPLMLVERGWSISTAASTISIALWLAVIVVPLGGFLADRSGRPQFVLVVGCIVSATLMVMLARNDAVVLIVIALGLISGQPAGAIMSLPGVCAAAARDPRDRDGHILHALLWSDDAGPHRCRRLHQMDRQRSRGLRFRRRRGPGVPGVALDLQSHSSAPSLHRLNTKSSCGLTAH